MIWSHLNKSGLIESLPQKKKKKKRKRTINRKPFELTPPILLLISLMLLMSNSTMEMLMGLNSTPISPDLIGVKESTPNVLFHKLQPNSVTEFTHVNSIFFALFQRVLLCSFLTVKDGKERGWEGSSALWTQENKALIRVKPSPSEWWSLNTKHPIQRNKRIVFGLILVILEIMDWQKIWWVTLYHF
jgi:hypothetical protein